MKEIHESIPYSDCYKLPDFITRQCNPEELLFFDIETTGFAAGNTILYLIGVLYYNKNEIHILQWFNENGQEEKEILTAFFRFTQKFTHLIHYNGSGFDIPYLQQKARIFHIPFSLDQMQQIDIYKEIRPNKKIFGTENLKQVTIENFLNLERQDTYTGGELIPVYQRYIRTKSIQDEKLLLLHNHDDLLGMPQFCIILNYSSFFKNPDVTACQVQMTDEKEAASLELYFTIPERLSLPKRILYEFQSFYLNVMDTQGFLSIPVTKGTLFHFFSDYKNYYYLPNEDMAIHKSVATYVEASNRIKATKNNCYVKKTDAFIPCHKEDEQHFYLFSNSYKDKQSFILADDLTKADEAIQIQYIKHIITTIK